MPRFWTDAENRQLVEDYYPWFLDTYDALPLPIMKADAVRLCYMHLYGGEHSTALPGRAVCAPLS